MRKLMWVLALVALATGAPSWADDNFCKGCKSFVSFARQFNSSSQRAEYRDVFKNYCELYYPVSTDYQQGPCPLFVEGLFYVLDHTDPISHCDQIGACDAERASQPSDDIYDYMKNSNNIKPVSTSKGARDNVICEFCEQMVNQVKNTLKDPAVIDQVKQQLDSVCEYLEVVGQAKECRAFLDKYIDQAITFIQDLDPKGYCASISLCSPSSKLASRRQTALNQLASLPSLADFQNFGIETSVVIGEKVAESKSAESKLGHITGPGCMLCKTVIKELFHFLRENRTEANIMKGLEQVCSTIYSPGTKREQCDSMVKAYTREIVQLLIDETDPEMVCMLLEQCLYAVPYKTLLVNAVAKKPELADLITTLDSTIEYKSTRACLECRMFIEYLRSRLSQKETKADIVQWLQANLCGSLPPSNQLRDACRTIVEENAGTFLKAAQGLLNPRAACRDLGVCSRQTLVSLFNLDESTLKSGLEALPLSFASQRVNQAAEASKKISNRPLELRGQMCDQCVEIVSQIDDYLSSHPIDQDVSVIIDKVCNNLPEGTVRGECTYIIKTFGAEIVQAISTMDNPRQLCSKIYLCNATAA